MKVRQYNGQIQKDKHNDLQSIARETKDREARTPLKAEIEGILVEK